MAAKQTTTGFQDVPCIKCGVSGGVVVFVDDCSTLRCLDCDNQFTTDEVVKMIGAWQSLLLWLRTAPVVEE